MASIKFQLQTKSSKSAYIYVRFSVARGVTPKVKTNILINTDKWNFKKGFPKNTNQISKSKAIELKELETAILTNYNIDYPKGIEINSIWLKNVVANFHNLPLNDESHTLVGYGKIYVENLASKVMYGNKVGAVQSTMQKYQNIINKVANYEAYYKKKVKLIDVNVDFRDDFYNYLIDAENLSENTAGRYIAFVKTIVRDAQFNGKETHTQLNRVRASKTKIPIVTLSFDEIDAIKKTNFKDNRLENARDWLVIGCYVGQRVSDLLRLNKSMIETIDGDRYITLIQQKTKKRVQFPIHPIVEEVLNKRNGEFPELYTSNMESNKTMLNEYVKLVCEEAKINELTRGNLRNEDGRTVTGDFKKFKLITTHTFRRSFCTNFYGHKELTTPLLMSISGHSTEAMFLNYIGKKPLDDAKRIANIWKRS